MQHAIETQSAPDRVYHAVADHTRRRMLLMLTQSRLTVSELSAPFAMSQPAVSQHLKVLRDAGLVRAEYEGRRRFYSIEAAPLYEVFDWVRHFEKFWDEKLMALGAYLEKQTKLKKRRRTK